MKNIDFKLPKGFIEFFSNSNGGSIKVYYNKEIVYVILWQLTDMIKLNKDYEGDKYAPNSFVFGSDEGGTAYFFEKGTGYIYERGFISMPEDAVFICKSFDEFLLKPLR